MGVEMNLTRWTSPSEAVPDTTEFKYGPLISWKTGIRLAQILPGSGHSGISINLVDSFVSGTRCTPYDALSYTWGDLPQNKYLVCNGKRLAVTQTLLEALHRFRHQSEIVTLWVDQICICQSRISERNQQVQLMDQIFKGAHKVIVWLGDDYDDSKAGMQLARRLRSIARSRPGYGLKAADFEALGLPRRGHRRWAALSAILRRPWFWRTWVIQEVVLNPNVELVLGSAVLSWSELESIVRLLEETPQPTTWDFSQAIDASELPFSRINRIRMRHLRLIDSPATPSNHNSHRDNDLFDAYSTSRTDLHNNTDDPELLDLLMMSRGLGATDPRDKIYALIGLSKTDVIPDYSMSPESVFNTFAQQTVGLVTDKAARSKAADMLMSSHDREVRRAMILISCAGRHNQSLDLLQSWVPDWTINLRSRPLIFGFDHKFAAGGDRMEVFDWRPEYGLELCGRLLDVVTVAGTVKLEYDPMNDGKTLHQDIKQWMQEARQVSDERISRSLGRLGHIDAFDAMLLTLSLCKHGYYTGGTRRRCNSLFDDSYVFDESSHNASHTLTLGPTRGRVAFVTSTGYIGLGPCGIREGDQVFVIMGGDIPWVLRPMDDAHEFLGEAYVQGVMDGEALLMEHTAIVDIMIR